MAKKKNSAAVELGRRGGKARLKTMTPEKRAEVAKKAAAARWKKNPDPDMLTVAEEEMETNFGSDGALPLEGTGAPVAKKKAVTATRGGKPGKG